MSKHANERIRGLTGRLKKRCLDLYTLFPACRQSAENARTHELLDYLEREYRKEFGPPSLLSRLASGVVSGFAYLERLKLRNPAFMYQPPTRYTAYNLAKKAAAAKKSAKPAASRQQAGDLAVTCIGPSELESQEREPVQTR